MVLVRKKMSYFLEKPLELNNFNQKKRKTYGFYKNFLYKKDIILIIQKNIHF